jgi:geranylgeranyl diphosphate synthase type II
VAFDEATAILAGDALLTLAFEMLAEAAERARQPDIWIANLKEIAQAAGCIGMIAGQMQDMDAEGKALTREKLEALHRLKTGAMIRVSVRSGARIGHATGSQLQALSAYADHLGLAFQVTDDILNVEGDPAEMGKAAGTDSVRNKNTYPALLGLRPSKGLAQELVDHALNALDIFGQEKTPLEAIARYVLTRRH